MQASLQTTTDEKAAERFLDIHEGMRKAQTSLVYTQPIQGMVRSWVRGKKVWFGGGERGILILRFLPGLFWGKCPAGITHHPNE